MDGVRKRIAPIPTAFNFSESRTRGTKRDARSVSDTLAKDGQAAPVRPQRDRSSSASHAGTFFVPLRFGPRRGRKTRRPVYFEAGRQAANGGWALVVPNYRVVALTELANIDDVHAQCRDHRPVVFLALLDDGDPERRRRLWSNGYRLSVLPSHGAGSRHEKRYLGDVDSRVPVVQSAAKVPAVDPCSSRDATEFVVRKPPRNRGRLTYKVFAALSHRVECDDRHVRFRVLKDAFAVAQGLGGRFGLGAGGSEPGQNNEERCPESHGAGIVVLYERRVEFLATQQTLDAA